jgi:uncharacterized RDD family membrane protein YckC
MAELQPYPAPPDRSVPQPMLGPHDPKSRRQLVTPEGIDLSLGLARIGQRVGALTLDLLIMGGSMVVLTIAIVLMAQALFATGSEAALELLGVLWLLGFFLIRNFYFILMEAGTRAATFGKRLMRLRVVARSGERLTPESVIARNLMREIEVYLPISYLGYTLSQEGGADPILGWLGAGWVLLFLLFPLFNKDRLRVGDLLAGTWVVMIPKRDLAYDLGAHAPEWSAPIQFTPEQLDTYGVYELQTLEQVLRDANPETMGSVAGTIRQKIGYWGPGDAYEFLTAYYAAARAHMERGLLFGKRRADKFDR